MSTMDSLDCELIELVNRLNKVQSRVGGAKVKSSSSSEERLKLDKFLDLRTQLTDKLEELKSKIEISKNPERLPGNNPRELIALKSDIRNSLIQLGEGWQELSVIYGTEAKKKKVCLLINKAYHYDLICDD